MVAVVADQLKKHERLLLIYVFGLSAIGFALQVLLTRVFSVIFQYHFVFLIVSIAIAGLSIGAALAAIRHNRTTHVIEQMGRTLVHGVLLLSVLLIGLVVVLSLLQSASASGMIFAIATFPYIVIGYLNARIYASFAASSGQLYAADLIGGACGLVGALAAITITGAVDAILLLAICSTLIALMPTYIVGQRTLRLRVLGIIALLIVGYFLNSQAQFITFSPEHIADAAPDKTMMQVLERPDSHLIETRWDSFARLDMVSNSDDSLRYIFTDAGAGSLMIPYDGADNAIANMRADIEYLPFTVDTGSTDDVLILGSGAGRDILLARLANAQTITAVEINPSLVELTRAYAAYNGDVYDLPGVRTIVADGRHYVETSQDTYDLIYANVVYSQAAGPGHSALAENYIFTREALQAYWERLSENGRIAFVTHHGIEGMRLLIAALDMLQSNGMPLQQALKHVSLVSLQGGDPQARTSVVMIRRNPWTPQLANLLAAEAHQRAAGALYLPGYIEIGLEPMITGAITLKDFITANSDFKFVPTTDDTPFFYQFRPGLPGAVADLLLMSVIVAFVYLAWAIFFFVRRDGYHWKRVTLVPYFALLGIAFLLVEAPLIQRFSLLVGQPILALIAILTALLAGGGLGSYFSSRYSVEQLPHLIRSVTIGIAIVIMLTLVIYPTLIEKALPLGLTARLVITVIAILPLGFLMGMPFPSGLRMAARADSQGIAAFWGANAATSVLGAALAMVLAMTMGFSASLIVGLLLYLTLAGIVHFRWPSLLST